MLLIQSDPIVSRSDKVRVANERWMMPGGQWRSQVTGYQVKRPDGDRVVFNRQRKSEEAFTHESRMTTTVQCPEAWSTGASGIGGVRSRSFMPWSLVSHHRMTAFRSDDAGGEQQQMGAQTLVSQSGSRSL